jgi:hypothetical protein
MLWSPKKHLKKNCEKIQNDKWHYLFGKKGTRGVSVNLKKDKVKARGENLLLKYREASKRPATFCLRL